MPDVLQALREFVARVDRLDPDAPVAGELTLGLDGRTERLTIRGPVAAALVEALAAWHDPRDNGTCAHCGTGALDTSFVCRECGIVNGVFGRTLVDFVARDQRAPAGADEITRGRRALDGPAG